MAEHCLREDHSFNNVSGKMLRVCWKGPSMNKYEEIETIATYQTIGNKLQNDLTATYVTPIVRYFYNFDPNTCQFQFREYDGFIFFVLQVLCEVSEGSVTHRFRYCLSKI